MAKKKWAKPQLIILVKQTPPEVLLQTCKNWAFSSGPYPDAGGCLYSTCSPDCSWETIS